MTGDDLAGDLLVEARSRAAAGDVAAAWLACAELAALARSTGDTDRLVEAALVLRAPGEYDLRARVHALAREALGRAPADDPRRERLVAQVAATRNPHAARAVAADPADLADPEASFLRLQAEVSRFQNPLHVEQRLALADRAIGLGTATGTTEYEAWGRRWRMDAAAELGRPVDLEAERASVAPLVEGLGAEWQSWLLLTRASTRLLEGDVEASIALADRALEVGGPTGTAAFFHVAFATEYASWTGRDAARTAERVTEVTDGLPLLARSWLAQALLYAGDVEGAQRIWSGLRPHVSQMPEDAPEWLIAAVGHAELVEVFADAEVAAELYDRLLPVADRQAIGLSHTPHHGPVSLTLGRLALVAQRVDDARTHLHDAVRSATGLQALPHLALAHLHLAGTYASGSRSRVEHAARAANLARAVGATSVLDRAEALAERSGADARLTPREWEVALLVADGLSNADVARRLVLSERTVENHVAHALHKLDLRTRAGLVAHVHTRT